MSSENYGDLSCSLCIETLNAGGRVVNKVTLKDADVTLGRDQFRDLMIKVGRDKYLLKDVQILHKFIR